MQDTTTSTYQKGQKVLLLIHNHKNKEDNWENGTVTAICHGIGDEQFDRVSVQAESGMHYEACHPECVKAIEPEKSALPVEDTEPEQDQTFYCADWNRCGSICEQQCPACKKADSI
ncbi:MAG: hypothetical protein IM631_12890 [Cytophagales bacterium]|nr:hypothetical protein [Cytophagales bacterium]MCA6382414.1 hypothetical protein [Cytophagales bacterium]